MRGSLTRWRVPVFLLLATTLLYLDRQTFALLAPTIKKELSLSNTDFGSILSVFYYAYTVGQMAIGAVLDRVHLRWAYGVGVLLWSGAVFLTGTAQGLAGLLVFRICLGLIEAVNWPGAMRIVARSLPVEERPLGNGIFTSGTSVGALIAPVLVIGIATQWGWRTAFQAVAGLGALWFCGWLLVTRHERARQGWRGAGTDEHQPKALWHAYREIFHTPQFWRVLVVSVLVNPCLYFNLNWTATYFDQDRGLPPASQRTLLTLIFLGLDAGYLCCGAAVLWLMRCGVPMASAYRRVFLPASACLACAGLAPFVESLNAAVALLVVANFGVGIWIAMYLTMAQGVSRTHVSTAAGLLGGFGSLAGAFLMRVVGGVTDQTNSFMVVMLGVSVAAVAAAFAGLAAVRRYGGQQPLEIK